jgi:hypothetical protein
MAFLRCGIYEPPFSDFPPLIVVFSQSGEVLAVHPVASVDWAEMLLAQVLARLQAAEDDLGQTCSA